MSLRERVWSLRGPLGAAAFALAFALVLFARGHPYDLDQAGLGIPYARILRDALRAHRAPLWTDLIWCGYPAHAEGQGGFLAFPFRLAAVLAPGDEVNGIEVETALVLVLAAFAAALASRILGRSHLASAASGMLWALGGGLLSYQENPAVLEACWAMPLLVALGARTAGEGARTSALVGGALLGLMLLAGWPYAFAMTVPLLACTWRWRPLALAVGLGLLLGAAQWVPTAELFLQSDRATGLDPIEVAGIGLVEPGDLARIVSPLIPMAKRVDQHSIVFVYLGLPAVALVLVGWWRSVRERRLVLPSTLVVALLVAFLAALAPSLALKLATVPPLSFVRGPTKLFILFGLAASLLAAEGLDAIPRHAKLALVVLALDLFQYGQRRALIVDREVLRTTPDVARAIPPGARTHVIEPRSLYWMSTLDARAFRTFADFDPNANVLWGIPGVSGYGPLPIGRSKELAQHPLPGLLARAGTEYLVSHRYFRDIEHIGTFAKTNLYRFPGGVPLARLASDAVVASDSAAAFQLASRLPPTIAVLEEPLAQKVTDGRARVVRQVDGAIEVAVEAAGPALLVVSSSWAPGWEALVDGKSAPIVRADYAFLAVPLPEGARRVELTYRPGSFRAGLALSALGAILLLLLARRRGPGVPLGT